MTEDKKKDYILYNVKNSSDSEKGKRKINESSELVDENCEKSVDSINEKNLFTPKNLKQKPHPSVIANRNFSCFILNNVCNTSMIKEEKVESIKEEGFHKVVDKKVNEERTDDICKKYNYEQFFKAERSKNTFLSDLSYDIENKKEMTSEEEKLENMSVENLTEEEDVKSEEKKERETKEDSKEIGEVKDEENQKKMHLIDIKKEKENKTRENMNKIEESKRKEAGEIAKEQKQNKENEQEDQIQQKLANEQEIVAKEKKDFEEENIFSSAESEEALLTPDDLLTPQDAVHPKTGVFEDENHRESRMIKYDKSDGYSSADEERKKKKEKIESGNSFDECFSVSDNISISLHKTTSSSSGTSTLSISPTNHSLVSTSYSSCFSASSFSCYSTSITSLQAIQTLTNSTVSARERSLLFGCDRVDNFKKLNKISEGTYGSVYRALNLKTNQIVALKHIKYIPNLWLEGFPITSLREISILLELKHQNIIDVHEVVVGKGQNQVYMVMEYIEHELKALLDDNKPEFSNAERKCLLLQLLHAVDYMHKNWVIHRDLKTSNLLYSNQGVLKVCDFGMARKFGDPIKAYTHNVVTLWYRAPELLCYQPCYNEAVDIWSVGCIFAELVLRKPLFPGHGEADTLNKIFALCGTPTEESWPGFYDLPFIKNGKYFSKVPQYTPSWRDTFLSPTTHLAQVSGSLSDLGLNLLQRMLCLCPDKRITASEAISHEYFKEKPKSQVIALMPTVPETNSRVRRKRRNEKSLEYEEKKQQELFHDAAFRFDERVDATKFLNELERANKKN